jgi:hypothetical protein
MQNSYKGWNKILLSKIKEVYLENALNATVFRPCIIRYTQAANCCIVSAEAGCLCGMG